MKATPTLLAASLLAGTAPAALFTGGHADVFAIGYEDEDTPGVFELEPHVHAEGATIDGMTIADDEFEPGDITVQVPQSTYDFIINNGGRPADAAWAPIGVAAGAGYWFLPQINSGAGGAAALGAPFAGVGTEELTAADWTTPISIALQSVSGPGEFSMWLDGFSPSFVMSTADGIDGSDVLSVDAGTHEHYNWGFTQPGLYSVTITASGTHATDNFQEATATYQFSVVPEPSTALFGIGSVLLLLRRRRP